MSSVKVVGKIENFDRNKSYTGFELSKTIRVPIYPDPLICPCQYGYSCDDPNFDYSKPIGYKYIKR